MLEPGAREAALDDISSIFAVYAGLFASALLAATILPGQSEVVLVALVATGEHDWVGLLVTATVGNVLGSVINWWIGRRIASSGLTAWSPAVGRACDRATGWFNRYGSWSLLLAWVPWIGDPLTLVAGALRVGLLRFVTLVSIGKAGRYLLVIAATLWWT